MKLTKEQQQEIESLKSQKNVTKRAGKLELEKILSMLHLFLITLYKRIDYKGIYPIVQAARVLVVKAQNKFQRTQFN